MNDRTPDNVIEARPLEAAAFASYGDVIEPAGRASVPMNQDWAERWFDLAVVDVETRDGRPQVSLARSRADGWPVRLRVLERHPLGSQIFMPLTDAPFLVVVAGDTEQPTATDLRAFVGRAGQGVNYRRGVWHHPMVALERPSEFLILDRQGPGANCEEIPVPGGPTVVHWRGTTRA